MNFSEQVRDLTWLQASKMIVEFLRMVSDERLIQLTQGDIDLMVTPEQRNHLRKRVIDFCNDGPIICLTKPKKGSDQNGKGIHL